MTDFVLDASVTLAWCFTDEETPQTRAIFDRMRTEAAVVPAVWPLEVTNVLLIGERRQRLTHTQTTQFLLLLRSLAIRLDPRGTITAFSAVLTLGREHNLSAYDAAYLELAMRSRLPLATQDAQLRAAATRVGVALLA